MLLSDLVRQHDIRYVVVNVSDGPGTCHLRCSYCSLNYFKGEQPTVMTEDQMRLACQYIKWHFPKNVSLHFFGTEPLMFSNLLFLARELLPDAEIGVTTNGIQLQLDDSLAQRLYESRIYVTILSCDGPYHDQHRLLPSGEGSLKYVKRAWELLPDYKWQRTTLRATWRPGQRLVEFFKFAEREFGTRHVTPIPDIYAEGWNEQDVAEQVMELADYLNGELVQSTAYRLVFDQIRNPTKAERRFCGMNEFCIGPNLEVYGCHHLPQQTKYGNIVTNEVYESGWRFIQMQRKLATLPVLFECNHCHARVACPVTGACPVSFLQTTKRAHVPSQQYCEFAKGFVSGVYYWLSLANKNLVQHMLKGGLTDGNKVSGQ